MHRLKNKKSSAHVFAQSFVQVLSHVDGCAPVVVARKLIERVPDGRLWDPDAKRALFCRLHERDMLRMTPEQQALALGVIAEQESNRMQKQNTRQYAG